MSSTKATLTADIIIEYGDGQIVLVRRKNEPYKGMWALPGGMMEDNETIETTALREAKEETGLDVQLTGIVGVYSDPNRDPRGRYISVAFTAIVSGGRLKAADDAAEIKIVKIADAGELAFDHNKILADYVKQRILTSNR